MQATVKELNNRERVKTENSQGSQPSKLSSYPLASHIALILSFHDLPYIFL